MFGTLAKTHQLQSKNLHCEQGAFPAGTRKSDAGRSITRLISAFDAQRKWRLRISSPPLHSGLKLDRNRLTALHPSKCISMRIGIAGVLQRLAKLIVQRTRRNRAAKASHCSVEIVCSEVTIRSGPQ